ncbi:hypothetical protein CQA57_05665 [Helicobacter anseris]|uniref:Uncharacterized protein n=1 Tax=Helicobacter anseris TaxID=375926 RepID=A0A3D8J6G0_9HELI|nr:hypothetical protein [Helicobacter anseris]RDU73012.1 hypothetical protein CQA57_05665 [Helicobacter anseris]
MKKLEKVRNILIKGNIYALAPYAKCQIKDNTLFVKINHTNYTKDLSCVGIDWRSMESLMEDVAEHFYLLQENDFRFDDDEFNEIWRPLDQYIKRVDTPYYYNSSELESYFDYIYSLFKEQILSMASKENLAISSRKEKSFFITPKTIYPEISSLNFCNEEAEKAFFKKISNTKDLKNIIYDNADTDDNTPFFAIPNNIFYLNKKQRKAVKDVESYIVDENFDLNVRGLVCDVLNNIGIDDLDDRIFLSEEMVSYVYKNKKKFSSIFRLKDYLLEKLLQKHIKYNKKEQYVYFVWNDYKKMIFDFKADVLDELNEAGTRFRIRNLKDFNGKIDFVFELELAHTLLDVEQKENIYHFSIKKNFIIPLLEKDEFDSSSNCDLMRSVIDILLRRERTKLNGFDYAIKPHLKEFFVDVKDSYNAGNCVIGTEQFMQKFGLKEQKEIRADKLFALDSSNAFVRRAIIAAYQKFKENEQSVY